MRRAHATVVTFQSVGEVPGGHCCSPPSRACSAITASAVRLYTVAMGSLQAFVQCSGRTSPAAEVCAASSGQSTRKSDKNAGRNAVRCSLRFWATRSSARPALRDPPWQPLCPAEVQTRRQRQVAAKDSLSIPRTRSDAQLSWINSRNSRDRDQPSRW